MGNKESNEGLLHISGPSPAASRDCISSKQSQEQKAGTLVLDMGTHIGVFGTCLCTTMPNAHLTANQKAPSDVDFSLQTLGTWRSDSGCGCRSLQASSRVKGVPIQGDQREVLGEPSKGPSGSLLQEAESEQSSRRGVWAEKVRTEAEAEEWERSTDVHVEQGTRAGRKGDGRSGRGCSLRRVPA